MTQDGPSPTVPDWFPECLVDAFYYCYFRWLKWQAIHVSKDMEEAKKLERIIDISDRVRRLPPDRQARVTDRFLALMEEQKKKRDPK